MGVRKKKGDKTPACLWESRKKALDIAIESFLYGQKKILKKA